MLQLDEADQDLAPASDDCLSGSVVPFRRRPVGGLLSKPFLYGIALGRVADDALIDGIDLVPDRFERTNRERRPDDPELFDSRVFVEDVPGGPYRFIGRELGGAMIDGVDRENDSVIDAAAGRRPFIEQIEVARLRADHP